VATVVVAFPPAAGRADGVLRGNGVLVPARSGRTLKAATFLSAKWPQLDAAGAFLVRLSAGRAGSSVVDDHDDGALVDALLADLADIAGLRADPLEVHVERWPRSIAQLEVGHLPRLRAIRAALPSGVLLAGAPYEGIGIAACVSSGQRAADALLDVPAPSGAPA
jgi:oxygen-dependent protoporphyrinogen oxidase